MALQGPLKTFLALKTAQLVRCIVAFPATLNLVWLETVLRQRHGQTAITKAPSVEGAKSGGE